MAYDHELGTMTVFMEASGDPDSRAGVIWTIKNRLENGHFGNTIAEVILHPFQFSSWNSNDQNRARLGRTDDHDKILLVCRAVVDSVLNGDMPDPTTGATFYFADGIPVPTWALKMEKTVTLGKQHFYRE